MIKTILPALAMLLAGCVVQSGSPKPQQNNAPPPPQPSHRSGPVKLAVFRPTLEPGLPEGGMDLNRFNDSWRGQFNDSAYDLSSQSKTDKAQKEESKGTYNAFTLGVDAVRLRCVIGTIKKQGYDTKQKKVVEVTLLKYTGTLEWNDHRTQSVTVEGNIFQNEQMVKDLAAKIKPLIRH